MPFLIGTDEAGYGPNLGPLVIAATVWEATDEQWENDLYQLLSPVVSRGLDSSARRLPIADSKTLYKPGGGLAGLEQGVLSALTACGHRVSRWRDAWRCLAPDCLDVLGQTPWYRDFDLPLPRDADAAEVQRLAAELQQHQRRIALRLRGIRCRVVLPAGFNELVDDLGSKGEVLTRLTLELIAGLLGSLEHDKVFISCDKHGGRSKYQQQLQSEFPASLVEVRREGRTCSEYRWGPASQRVKIRFVARGESFLPSALASMAAKYLRELAMLAFNDFWQSRVPGLKRTAGYPVDARRFKQDIAAAQAELNIDDCQLWRNR